MAYEHRDLGAGLYMREVNGVPVVGFVSMLERRGVVEWLTGVADTHKGLEDQAASESRSLWPTAGQLLLILMICTFP